MKYHLFCAIIFLFMSNLFAQQQGPIVAEKLIAPVEKIKQTLQKRSFFWIEGQWNIKQGQYVWVDGHWIKKKVGFIFVNGKWVKKSNGWSWEQGYWKKIDINKWKVLYS